MNKKFFQMIMFSSLLCASEESFGACFSARNMKACVKACSTYCKGENNINILIHPSRYCNHLTHKQNPCDCVAYLFSPTLNSKSLRGRTDRSETRRSDFKDGESSFI